MATLPKNGFEYTGYSEPFIADISITGVLESNASLIFNGVDDDAVPTVADAMRIENTVDKNNVTRILLSAVASNADTVLETKNTTHLVRVGDILEYDDAGTNRTATVTVIDQVEQGQDSSGNWINSIYNVTVTPALTLGTPLPAGKTIITTGKILDLGDGTLGGATAAVGDRVTVEVAPVGTYAL